MHAVVRKWKTDPSKVDETVRKIEELFVPEAQRVEGFTAYHVVQGENDDVFTITVCQDRQGIDETTRRSRAFVDRELKGIVRGPPEVMGGEVLLEAGAPARGSGRTRSEQTRKT